MLGEGDKNAGKSVGIDLKKKKGWSQGYGKSKEILKMSTGAGRDILQFINEKCFRV